MFIFDMVMPNGAQARFHKAVSFTVREDGTHAVVNSYHSAEMAMISWQDVYVIPLAIPIHSLADVEEMLTYTNAPFDGGQVVPSEEETLDTHKARLSAVVKLKRDEAEWAGVQTSVGVVDSDPQSQRKISGAVTMALVAGAEFTIDWRMKNNSVVTFDHDVMIAVGMAVGGHVAACQSHKTEIDNLIAAATTVEELLAINVEDGWPA